ncbi:beta-lactamase family protein [Streptomyces sp. OF3]|uniref:Beta-lactamase family protein n=1 Tax=Streptomyces alkaliterrae TaxID=2213162 RepID=A0A7W3WPC9_9ACTN|nr:serine hydrolase domain-containing protein [Streptomyces alkaliterrae]MBB1255974.1 beta-lactamase family protein [Streptomyces alkaliterrae]
MLLPTTERALLHRVATAQSEGRTPTLTAAVVREGELVWTGSRHAETDPEPTPDTQYRIGSITKPLVAVQVMRLRDEGLIDLADPLGKHLRGTQAGAATIGQLLSHTSGLAAEPRGPWWERTPGELRPDLADLVEGQPLRLPAGRRHHYSNTAYALLGALVAEVRGSSWDVVLRGEVLEPLGMHRTTLSPEAPYAAGWAVHPWADVLQEEPLTETGTMAPAGQLWSTAADLARLTAFLGGEGVGVGHVLSAETLEEMRRPLAPQAFEDWNLAWGLGVSLLRTSGGRVLVGHGGSMPGFVAAVLSSPTDRLGAVVLANVTSGPPVSGVAADLIRIVTEHEPALPRPWHPLTDPADPELLALTGTWYWGAAPHTLRLAADRTLLLGPLGGAGRGSRFRPEADGTWTGLDGYYAGETLRLARRADGGVSHLDVATFVLTREPYEEGAPIPGDTRPWRHTTA